MSPQVTLVRAVLVLVTFCLSSHLAQVGGQTCLTLTTFNAGLTPRIADYRQRLSLQPDALLRDDADVICLQEYWFEKDIAYLLDRVSHKYKYHFSPLHTSPGRLTTLKYKRLLPETPCSPGDSAFFYLRVLPCALLNGCVPLFLQSLELGLGCAAARCSQVFKLFNADCLSCITSTATSLTTMLDACKPESGEFDNRYNAPGVVLLSKQEILSAEYTSYFPGKEMTIQRGYIEAQIKDFGAVLCSHFSSVFSTYFEYDNLGSSSYSEQQRAEMEIINRTVASRDAVVMGDFNTGPRVDVAATPDRVLTGEAPDNFQTWLDNGFNTTYITDDGRCTYCKDNDLVSYSNNVIDFVMFRGDYTIINTQRTMDSSPPLSDHYGVKTTLCTGGGNQQ